MTERLGDAPIEAALLDLMNTIARGLNEAFNGEAKGADRDWGFVLMVFPYGDHTGRCNYISNGADLQDVFRLMKEMIARFEGQPEMKGRA